MGQPPGIVGTLREAVSPWLWAFSLAGFGMTVLNTRRIAKMFGKFGGKKK